MKNRLLSIIFFILLFFSSEVHASQAWKSIILPGWGEKALGHKDKSKIFLLSEYIMWTGFIFSDYQYSSYRDSYRSHGTHYAGVNWNGKNSLFAAHVGNYDNLALYNLLYGDVYFENYMDGDIPEESPEHKYYWDWDGNTQERLKYDTWRNRSEKYDKTKNFIVAGMVINRIISFLDVIILERKDILTSELTYSYDHTASLKIHYNF